MKLAILPCWPSVSLTDHFDINKTIMPVSMHKLQCTAVPSQSVVVSRWISKRKNGYIFHDSLQEIAVANGIMSSVCRSITSAHSQTSITIFVICQKRLKRISFATTIGSDLRVNWFDFGVQQSRVTVTVAYGTSAPCSWVWYLRDIFFICGTNIRLDPKLNWMDVICQMSLWQIKSFFCRTLNFLC